MSSHGVRQFGDSIAARDGLWAYMDLREPYEVPDPCNGADIFLHDGALIERVFTCESHDHVAFLPDLAEPGGFALMTTAVVPHQGLSVRVTRFKDPLDPEALVDPPFVAFLLSDSSRPVPCGDVDGDGLAEVCATSMFAAAPPPPEEDDVLLPPEVSWETDASTQGVAGDLDGDGRDELYIAHAGGLSRVDGQGPGALDLATLPAWVPSRRISALATADLDGVGRAVLAAVGRKVWLVERGLGSARGFATVPAPIASLAVGDFDGDGVDDVAIGAPPNVLVVSADGRRRMWWRESSSFGFALAAADIDLDGFDDLLVGFPDGGGGLGAIYELDGPF